MILYPRTVTVTKPQKQLQLPSLLLQRRSELLTVIFALRIALTMRGVSWR